MKYLKTYNESKSPLNSLSDEDLEERLKWLSIEYKDIGDEMVTIRTILRGRKEEREEKHRKNMKYLKRYNLVLESSKILEDLDYLLLDIKDLGLNVSIKEEVKMSNDVSSHSIFISNSFQRFEFNSEIKETIIRINQYLREMGYKTQYIANYDISTRVFIIRPDEKLRYLDGTWIADNDNVLNIKIYFWMEKKST